MKLQARRQRKAALNLFFFIMTLSAWPQATWKLALPSISPHWTPAQSFVPPSRKSGWGLHGASLVRAGSSQESLVERVLPMPCCWQQLTEPLLSQKPVSWHHLLPFWDIKPALKIGFWFGNGVGVFVPFPSPCCAHWLQHLSQMKFYNNGLMLHITKLGNNS